MPSPVTTLKLIDLMNRVRCHVTKNAEGDSPVQSVLAATAARYGSQSSPLALTPPTGFDPNAAALFESLVETAFLVANADGEFDVIERQAFAAVVAEAADRHVSEKQIEAIVLDLDTQLEQDGLDRRLELAARGIKNPEDRQEALRMAGFIASISKGVSQIEQGVLTRLAELWCLPGTAVDELLRDLSGALEPHVADN